MKFPGVQTFAVSGRAALALAVLVTACVAPVWGQRAQTQTTAPAAVRPPVPAPPVRAARPPAVPIVTRIPSGANGHRMRPVRPPVVPPIPPTRPPLQAVRPHAATPFFAPTSAQNGIASAGKLPKPVKLVGRTGIAPVQFPPPTRRLLPAPPPVPRLIAAPAVALVSHLPHVDGIPPLPPGSKLYCSPWSVLYNTGSICFNPDIETINPDFYPWGLFSPPAFVNAPGFVPPFPPGLLIRFCPQCAAASAGLIPAPTPLDRWRQTTSGRIASLRAFPRFTMSPTPAPPSSSVMQQPGAAIVLVLSDGTRKLVSRYWLGQDWLLHFITVTGSRQAIPLNRLNLKATGASNYERGVTFVMPAWPEPQRTR